MPPQLVVAFVAVQLLVFYVDSPQRVGVFGGIAQLPGQGYVAYGGVGAHLALKESGGIEMASRLQCPAQRAAASPGEGPEPAYALHYRVVVFCLVELSFQENGERIGRSACTLPFHASEAGRTGP